MTVDDMMFLLEQVARNIGFSFMLVGGLLLFGVLVALAVRLMCELWIGVSIRFRSILKAESLIYEYRKNRDEFLRRRSKKERT